jgi:hypothetical protein
MCVVIGITSQDLVERLLCSDSKMGGYTRAVPGQRLCKHVPVTRQHILNEQQFDYNNGRVVFSLWYEPGWYKQGTRRRR